MMRYVKEHQADDADNAILISVMDDPGPGGANHAYEFLGRTPHGEYMRVGRVDFLKSLPPRFVDGKEIPDPTVNGTTNEALLAVVADRLRAFQTGPYPCPDNDKALRNVEEALKALHKRTKDRRKRGVEGLLKK
jgi:hypothetical protein